MPQAGRCQEEQKQDMGQDCLTVNAAKGHARASADEGRESLAVGSNELATFAGILLHLVEVKDEIAVVGQESETVCSTIRVVG